MSNNTNNQNPTDQVTDDTVPDQVAADAPETEDAAATDGNELSPEAMEAAIRALQAENDELKDKLLRAVAEQENLRRRAEREKAEALQYASTNFARDLLPVLDNFARAIAAIPTGAAEQDETFKNLVVGVELVEREMLNAFERHGIRRFDPQGERFDPHLHQAVFEVEDPSQPSGMVVQVLQTGYMIGERVLRPAMVGVSKGGPRPDAQK
jgi:molecular chaperone GrpE